MERGDLFNVTVLAEDGVVIVDDADEAAAFLESDLAQWISAPLGVRQDIANLVRSLAPRTVHGALRRQKLNVSGHFVDVEVRTEVLANNFVGLSWQVSAANFTSKWANPFWEAGGWSPETETRTVARLVREAATELRGPSPQPSFANAPTLLTRRSSRIWHLLAQRLGELSSRIR